MSKTDEATYITVARRELAKWQGNARFFAAQYRASKTQEAGLAHAYRIMAKLALTRVHDLKRYIQKAVAIQRRLDELALRIAELQSRAQKLSERSPER